MSNEIKIVFLETNQTVIYGAPCPAYHNYFIQKEAHSTYCKADDPRFGKVQHYLNVLIDLEEENSLTVALTNKKYPLEDQNIQIGSIYELHFDLDNAE